MGFALKMKRLTRAGDEAVRLYFFAQNQKGSVCMCMKNNQPVNELCSPCGRCPEYLNTCKPLIVGGCVFGECDLCYCEFCDHECEERG